MKRADLRPMGLGEVLDRSFQMLRRHMGTLWVTAVLGMAPLLVAYILLGVPSATTVPEDQLAAMGGVTVLLAFLFLVTVTIAYGALTRQLDQGVAGGEVSMADGFRRGVRSFLPILGLMLLAYLAGVGLLIPVGIVAAVVGTGSGLVMGETAGLVLTAALMVGAAVFAGLLWAPLAFLSLPAMIAERIGPIRALRRAHELGKGGRLRIVATAGVAWIIMMLPTIGIPFLFGFGAEFWSASPAGTISSLQFYMYQAATFAVGGLTTPYMVAVMVFAYYDRRVRREGYDVELASETIPLNA